MDSRSGAEQSLRRVIQNRRFFIGNFFQPLEKFDMGVFFREQQCSLFLCPQL